MPLPRQVQEANERADAILKEIEGGKPEGAAAPEQELAADPKPAATATPKPEKAPAAETDAQKLDVMTQKYNVINGKYNAEVPAVHGENKRLLERIEELEKANTESDEAKDKQADDDLDEYPDGLVNYIRNENAKMKATIKTQGEIIESLQSTSANTVQNQFNDTLTQLVPDWRDINANQEFITWLNNTVEPSSNRLQMKNLNDAHQAGDATRVAFIFDMWKSHSGRVNTPTQESQQPKGDLPPVVPSNANANQPAPNTQGQVYTKDWIRNWSKEQALGQTGMTPEEITRINQDIDAAQFQGRVVD